MSKYVLQRINCPESIYGHFLKEVHLKGPEKKSTQQFSTSLTPYKKEAFVFNSKTVANYMANWISFDIHFQSDSFEVVPFMNKSSV